MHRRNRQPPMCAARSTHCQRKSQSFTEAHYSAASLLQQHVTAIRQGESGEIERAQMFIHAAYLRAFRAIHSPWASAPVEGVGSCTPHYSKPTNNPGGNPRIIARFHRVYGSRAGLSPNGNSQRALRFGRLKQCRHSAPRMGPRSTTRIGAAGSRSCSAMAGRSRLTRSRTRCSSSRRAAIGASRTTAAGTAAPASRGPATTWTPTPTTSPSSSPSSTSRMPSTLGIRPAAARWRAISVVTERSASPRRFSSAPCLP